MNVEISGAVLSSLFFEHSVCNNDLEGFLLGRITSRCTDTISDAQISGIKEETTCYIYSYISCSKPFTWYTNSGATDPDKLKTVLSAEQIREVVGWFKFRRNSTLITSLRERAIHCHLLKCLPGIMAQNFLFLLCTLQQSPNKSTHTMDHVFQVYNGSSFQGLPVSMINLGDNVTNYKLHGTSSFNCKSGMFSDIINKHCDDFLGQHGQIQSVLTMHKMSRALNEQLQDLCISVWASEDELQQLRCDVRQLKTKLKPQKPKPESGRRDLNPFKTASISDVSMPQARQAFSPKNPFYSGYQAMAVPTSVYEPPPPYSEKDDFFADHTNNFAVGSTSADLLTPDIDLIALGDSEEDLEVGTKFGICTEFSDNNIDSLLDQPTTLLDTSIPEIVSEPLTDWNISGSAVEAGAFGVFDNVANSAVPGQSSSISKPLQDGSASSLDRSKLTNVSHMTDTSGESPARKAKVLEAIEQSSDEDQRES